MLEYEFETHDEMIKYRSIGKEKLSITVEKIANL